MKETKNLIKVAFVDDHMSMIEPLAERIEGFGKITCTFLAQSGAELMERLTHGELPDVIVLDLFLPDMDGFEIARWVIEKYPSIRIVIFTIVSSEFVMIRLLRMGVSGFVNKGVKPKVVADAIVSAVEIDDALNHLPSELLVKFIRIKDFELQKFGLLPDVQDIQFIKLSCSELKYVQIASIMGISVGAVDKIRANVFEMLHVKTRVGLVKFAIRHGIVSPGYEEKDSFSFL